jgi:phosphatidylserine decarboxylase
LKFANDGIPTIVCCVVLTAVAFLFSVPAAAAMVLLTGFALWFYRDPDRVTPSDANVFVSPADGRVVEIEDCVHPFTGPAVKVGIFMNAFSVHVNRSPCAGTVEYLKYVPGRKIAAFAPKASEVNERHYVGLSTEHGPVLMVQIAGLLARRIVCRLRRGDVLSAGERYGMIKLGSKVDLYIPRGVKLTVVRGDRLKAGSSVVGVF